MSLNNPTQPQHLNFYTQISKNLAENHPFGSGDSATKHHSADAALSESARSWSDFLHKLRDVAEGRVFPFTLEIRDPLGNRFVCAELFSKRSNALSLSSPLLLSFSSSFLLFFPPPFLLAHSISR
jgi:hypothetical protein